MTRPVSRTFLQRGVLALTTAMLVSSAYASEMKEVGIAPVTVGAGPFVYDSAEQHDLRVEVLARGLAHGYALAFLPNRDALIVERGTRLRLLRDATGTKPVLMDAPIEGAPDYSKQEHIDPEDVLGIQDIAIAPDFATTGTVYLTYNKPIAYDAASKRLTASTIFAKARLQGSRLTGLRNLIVGEAVHGAGGSRILIAPDGLLYVSVGALSYGDLGSAQRTDNIYGKVLRIAADGKIPADNPFVRTTGARPEIYTYGHRDPLGLTLGLGGVILASEHGPLGGDELNKIRSGRNYGWPKYSYGTQYGGSDLPVQPVGEGTQGPTMTWLPGIAPSGIAYYTGDKFPDWKGNLFLASARRGEINGTGSLIRVAFNGKLQELRQEILLGDLHQRFKDVRQGPDGLIYALTDEDQSVLVRLSPSPHQPG